MNSKIYKLVKKHENIIKKIKIIIQILITIAFQFHNQLKND